MFLSKHLFYLNPISCTDDSWGYDGGMDGDVDDSESVMTDLLSPGGQTDAQTLACMLQVVFITGIYILAIPPPLGGGQFLSKLKNGEEFKCGLHAKRKGKGGGKKKKEKSDKIPL